MIRAVTLSRLAAAFAMFGLATACNEPQSPTSPTPKASLLPWGGTIAVVNTTTGSDPDPNGYEVWVDDSYSQSPGSNGVSYFNGLSQGDHKVSLIMVAANCLVTATVNGVTAVDNPRNVSISAAETATTNFDVGCASVGSLVVGTNTTGVDLDADGYTVTVDGAVSQPAATNGNVTFTGLATGSHAVALLGVAGNCTLSGANPQTGSVSAGGTADLAFSLSCTPTGSGSGSLTVMTSTSGSNLDADGYMLTLDGTSSQSIAINDTVTVTVPTGDHPVALSGVAANCTASGANPRTVTVLAGGADTTTFAVTCSAQLPPPEVTGQGQLGMGSATPGNYVQTFAFDVRADPTGPTGRFTITDYSDLYPDGTPASMTTDHSTDAETSITAYRTSSSACADPSRGVELEGMGRVVNDGVLGPGPEPTFLGRHTVEAGRRVGESELRAVGSATCTASIPKTNQNCLRWSQDRAMVPTASVSSRTIDNRRWRAGNCRRGVSSATSIATNNKKPTVPSSTRIDSRTLWATIPWWMVGSTASGYPPAPTPTSGCSRATSRPASQTGPRPPK